jgi:hypothetical protein
MLPGVAISKPKTLYKIVSRKFSRQRLHKISSLFMIGKLKIDKHLVFDV